MPLSPVEFPRFGGLDLRVDPQEMIPLSALDAVDVDLSSPGRLRSRSGFAKLTAAPAAASYSALMPYYQSASATRQLIAVRGTNNPVDSGGDVLSTSGAVVDSFSSGIANHFSLVRSGTSTEARVIVFPFQTGTTIPVGVTTQRYWTGSAWNTLAIDPFGIDLGAIAACLWPTSNRVVVAATGVDPEPVVWFSDPGALTWGTVTSGFVQLTPGDGEYVINLTSFRDLVFAFKQSKFFVFYGTSSNVDGSPIFDYRAVSAGIGCVCHRGAVAAPEGIYFLDRTGVYITTGSTPEKVSGPLDPLFGVGSIPGYYSGQAINWAAIEWATLDYNNGRLFLSVPTGASTTNDTTFVLDTASRQWVRWTTPINGLTSFRVGDQEEIVFSLASGSNDIARMGHQPDTYTTDAGAPIIGRYRAGFWTPSAAAGGETDVFEWMFDGSGTITHKVAINDNIAPGVGADVTMGTWPAIDRGYDRRAVWGRNLSPEISGTAPWSVSRAIANVSSQTDPGFKAA